MRLGRAMPLEPRHWVAYYAKRFCKTRHPDAAHLAAWHQILDIIDKEKEC